MAFLGEAKGVSRQLRRLRSPLPLPLIRKVRDPGYSFVSDQMLLTPVYHCISLFQSACRSLSETFGDILGLTTAELKLAGILLAKKTWRKGKRFWFFFIATFDPKIPNTKIPTQTLKIFLSLNNEPPSWEDSCLLGIISRKQIRIHKRHREGEWGHQLFEPSLLATPLAYEHSSSVIYAGCFRVFIRKFSVSDNGKYSFSFLNCRPCIWRKIGLMLHF